MIIKNEIKEQVLSPANVAEIFKTILSTENFVDQDKEHFWIIGLNVDNTIKYIELVSLGCLTASIVQPRETFRLAIFEGVNSIIACHNHPSGSLKPSPEDIELTKKLKSAGEIIGIKLIDHVIITKNGHYIQVEVQP